ncbi:hypothetical protein I7I50_02552 [Histoplasma capsulatum G186AR]|nr:hypothetical protein I7I52_00785 [Histoplasma capsulatum]QSS71635.1 hypothetical protein I7I50_02552 [Histoplasma capsulatum G186AR]
MKDGCCWVVPPVPRPASYKTRA